MYFEEQGVLFQHLSVSPYPHICDTNHQTEFYLSNDGI